MVFVIGFVGVATRSFQQLNVMQSKWLSIIPNSYVMGVAHFVLTAFGVAEFEAEGWYGIIILGFFYGTGGWSGCWFGMWVHKRLHNQ